MKYVALNNRPNVSESRIENSSPSLKLDDRNFPHISWLGIKSGANEVNYRWWDGLQWAFNGLPTVYKSKETIIHSPNSLVLDSDENPAMAFSRRSAWGSKHAIVTSPSMNGEWTFNELDVDYETEWIGIIKLGYEVDVSSSSSSSSSSSAGDVSTSSSSSSSFEEILFYVVVYDSTNEEIKIYSVSSGYWTLIGSMITVIEDVSTIRIDSCGSEIGIAYFDDSGIWYNFFDIGSQSWAFDTSFAISSNSELYGTVRDMDFAGYHNSTNGFMAVGWVSGNTTASYVCNVLIMDDGTETAADGLSVVVETGSVNVTCSESYIINGYRKIGVCVDDSGVPQMITSGLSSKAFMMHEVGSSRIRVNSAIDIESPSNGIVPSSVRTAYRGSSDIVLTMALDAGDIYYFESSSDSSFPISTPDMSILNNQWLYHTTYSDGQLAGTQVSDTYDSYCANVLGETKRPVIVISDRTLIPPTTTTTTTTPSPITTTTTTTALACCTSMQPTITLAHGCVLSNWNINWQGYDQPGCKLYLYFGYGHPGLGFILVRDIGSGYVMAQGSATTSTPQTITIIPSPSHPEGYVTGTVDWNGIDFYSGDNIGPHTIYCV